jgi:hypothetical protein
MGSLMPTATAGLTAQDVPLPSRKKAVHGRRRIRILLRQVTIWLGNWGLRGYPHDTHNWASRTERLRSLKNITPAPPLPGAGLGKHPKGVTNGKG